MGNKQITASPSTPVVSKVFEETTSDDPRSPSLGVKRTPSCPDEEKGLDSPISNANLKKSLF